MLPDVGGGRGLSGGAQSGQGQEPVSWKDKSYKQERRHVLGAATSGRPALPGPRRDLLVGGP